MTYAELQRVTTGLEMDALRREKAVVASTRSPWAEDYGAKRKVPVLDAARLHDGWRGPVHGAGSSAGEGRLESRSSWLGQALWREVKSFCPGTKVFFGCVALVAFIAVV